LEGNENGDISEMAINYSFSGRKGDSWFIGGIEQLSFWGQSYSLFSVWDMEYFGAG
jgi:hypothetical protein